MTKTLHNSVLLLIEHCVALTEQMTLLPSVQWYLSFIAPGDIIRFCTHDSDPSKIPIAGYFDPEPFV